MKWLEQRFAEGLKIRIIREDGRSVGFIEYTPAEFAWRPVCAAGYLFVHCLWVVGRAKDKGFGSQLLELCLEDARTTGKHGVVASTRKGGHLVGKSIYLKHGYEVVDWAPPGFELVAKKLNAAASPAFPKNWTERQARYPDGLTVLYADQCPYFSDAVQEVLEAAAEAGVAQRQAIELKSAEDVQEKAPCPYGTFGIVYHGGLLTCTPLGKKKLIQRLQEVM